MRQRIFVLLANFQKCLILNTKTAITAADLILKSVKREKLVYKEIDNYNSIFSNF